MRFRQATQPLTLFLLLPTFLVFSWVASSEVFYSNCQLGTEVLQKTTPAFDDSFQVGGVSEEFSQRGCLHSFTSAVVMALPCLLYRSAPDLTVPLATADYRASRTTPAHPRGPPTSSLWTSLSVG